MRVRPYKVSAGKRDGSTQGNKEWQWVITRKAILFILSAAFFFMLLMNGITKASLRGSPHDIRVLGTESISEPCYTCHTPHIKRADRPLWDSKLSGQTYELYSSSSSETDQMKHPRSPSSLCLVCHNGIFSSLVVYRGPGSRESEDYDYVTNHAFWNMVDSHLKDGHPVGFTYDPARDNCCEVNNGFPATNSGTTDIQLKSSIPGSEGEKTYPLYGEKSSFQFECATCHAVHDTVSYSGKTFFGGRSVGSQAFFLRHSNAESSMCIDCHRNMY